MAQFLVLAYDGTEPGASDRRKAARPGHFEGVATVVLRLLPHHGGMLDLDVRTAAFTTAAVTAVAANGMLTRPYRAPYVVPERI